MRLLLQLQQLLLLAALAAPVVRCTVKICESAQVWARGRELLGALKGQLVLVAFPTTADRSTLDKLSSLAAAHSSVRFVALLEVSSCSAEEAAAMGKDYRWLVVDRDDIGSRQRLGLNPGDAALFDRCGRLARSLPLSSTEELNQLLRSAQHHASCGWCQYGTDAAAAAAAAGPDKKLDAFFNNALATQTPTQSRAYPHHHQQHNQRQQQQHQQHQPQRVARPLQQQLQPQQEAAYQEQLRQYYQNNQRQHQVPTQPAYRTPAPVRLGQPAGHAPYQQQVIRQNEYARQGQANSATPRAPGSTPQPQPTDDYGDYDEVMKGGGKDIDLRKPAFNDDAQWATAAPFYQKRQHKDLFARPPPTSYYESPPTTSRPRQTTTSTATTASRKTSNGAASAFEDYSDYEDYGAMKTFNSNNAEEKEREAEEARSQSRARSVSQQQRAAAAVAAGYDPDLLQDEDEVPCKAITDDICYHQKKSGRKLSKCCKKGIYIADFCLAGKCSNSTQQACCMQKYLQAKYQCCESAEMDGTTATDAFSRCCHAHFVEEDDCCPAEAAKEYWQSVHDICLPNVKADLSSVRFEIRLSDGIRVLDLAEPEKWQHECRYGASRQQYVYVP